MHKEETCLLKWVPSIDNFEIVWLQEKPPEKIRRKKARQVWILIYVDDIQFFR